MAPKRFLANAAIIALLLSTYANGFLVSTRKGQQIVKYDARIQRSPSSSAQHRAAALAQKLEGVVAREARLGRGILLPFLKELRPTKVKVDKISQSLSESRLLNIWEIFITVMMGWCLVPVANFISFNILQREEGKDLFGLKGRRVIKTISDYFKIDTYVYLADALTVAASGLGFKRLKQIRFALIVSKIGRTLWAMNILKNLKHYFLKATFKKTSTQEVLTLYERVTNILLYFITAALLVENLSVHIGIAISSVLSFGGLSTVILSLSSKGIAEQLISGIAISTSSRFAQGDKIQLGDGTVGRVLKITMSHTEICQSDESIIAVPNNQIFQQRVINLSKIKRNQVKQTLWFKYDDIDKMSLVTKEIKAEIKASCPKLIESGRPFRVHWRDIKKDHLEVVVDCRFDIPMEGDANGNNRQEVLEAISRAVKRCGMDFARPSYVVQSSV